MACEGCHGLLTWEVQEGALQSEAGACLALRVEPGRCLGLPCVLCTVGAGVRMEKQTYSTLTEDLRVQRALPTGDGDPLKVCEQGKGTDELMILSLKGQEESSVEDGREGNGVKAWECLIPKSWAFAELKPGHRKK